MKLSPQQEAARTAGDYARIVAGPGSGKTTLLVARTQYLVERHGARVGLVTFANAAAAEMRARLQGVVAADDVEVATFDAFARRQMLHKLQGRRPPRGFESKIMIRRALQETQLPLEEKEAALYIEELHHYLNPEQAHPTAWQLYEAYQSLMTRDGLIDFAEIARQSVHGMRAGEVQPIPVTHLLVDEYQDTAPIQYAWMEEHWTRGVKVTVVGDDDQSIYGFRQALGYKGMEDFAEATGAETHPIEGCYRCAPEIIEASGALIAHNRGRLDKTVRSMLNIEGEVSAGWIANPKMRMQVLERFIGLDRDVTGILARTNRVLDGIELYLSTHRYVVHRSGGNSFWDVPSNALMLALIEAACLPTEDSATALTNALSWADVSEQRVAAYRSHLMRNGLFAPLPESLARAPVVRGLHEEFAIWADAADSGVEFVLVDGVTDWLTSHASNKQEARAAAAAGRALQRDSDQSLLQRVLSAGRGGRNQAGVTPEPDPQAIGTVELATMHGAKGREWSSVWIANADEEVVPSKHALAEGVVGIEEERRLFYVAMTRAKRRLFIACSTDPSRFITQAGLSVERYAEAEHDDMENYDQASA